MDGQPRVKERGLGWAVGGLYILNTPRLAWADVSSVEGSAKDLLAVAGKVMRDREAGRGLRKKKGFCLGAWGFLRGRRGSLGSALG